MPDITNEDLMKLIYRLIKKQDTVDAKLDKVLEILHKSEVIDTTNEVFLFKPIKNLDELEAVTQRLESDPVFRRQLKAFLIKISRGNIKLEHIFSDEFLYDYNWPGVNGKKKLEGIALFDHYYVALKQKEGNSDTEIRKICNRELKQIKDRIFARNLRKKQQEKSTTGESSADGTESKPEEVTETVDEFVEIQDYLEFETVNDGEYYIEISQSDHEALNQDHNYHDMEESEINEKNNEENNEIEQISEEFSDDELLFPIKNDKELDFVTKKLQNDEKYKKQARALMRLHDDLKIDHIFTQEFLYEYNLTGVNGKKKLENLLPYTEIYECKSVYFHFLQKI
uniref:CSON002866 protein n=1 Tax=Culicoides sonorensis TaxID=179676 RepID=A0A336L097_CULSO